MNSPADGRATPTSSPAMASNPQKAGQFPSQQATTAAKQGVGYPVASSGRGFIPKSPNQLDPTAVRHPAAPPPHPLGLWPLLIPSHAFPLPFLFPIAMAVKSSGIEPERTQRPSFEIEKVRARACKLCVGLFLSVPSSG
ncbi:uncharacterized protein LOC104454682 [Eucalyptus grandis]|uniref:uncharacterized protein LOC104454682 n=1 Tax=Eucalyptus grandis TaxID=71139 RepID=UPI00192E9B68|nr:uncharacterized protein LOC104454682 [Eucalyptus grandis]